MRLEFNAQAFILLEAAIGAPQAQMSAESWETVTATHYLDCAQNTSAAYFRG
jgi:hypothetical protein